jgi:GLPGLI family protein
MQSYAQKNSTYTFAEYTMRVNFAKTKTFKSSLYFNNEHAAFIYNEIENDTKNIEEGENIKIKLVIQDTIKHKIYTQKRKNLLFEKQKNLLTKKEFYYTHEIIPILNWKISDKKGKIGKFLCNNATAEFRGRIYQAWFTTKVPTSFGPWKLNGLPGLIVKVTDSNNEIEFLLNKVQYNKKYKFNEFINNSICLNEHLEKEKESAINLKKRLESIASRGTKINVEIRLNKIEMNFNDIEKSYKCNE